MVKAHRLILKPWLWGVLSRGGMVFAALQPHGRGWWALQGSQAVLFFLSL